MGPGYGRIQANKGGGFQAVLRTYFPRASKDELVRAPRAVIDVHRRMLKDGALRLDIVFQQRRFHGNIESSGESADA